MEIVCVQLLAIAPGRCETEIDLILEQPQNLTQQASHQSLRSLQWVSRGDVSPAEVVQDHSRLFAFEAFDGQAAHK